MAADGALQATQLIVIEFDIAGWHATNLYRFCALECENLIQLWPVDKLELNSIACLATRPLIEAAYFRLTLPVISLEEIDCQVGSTEGDDETVFKREWHVESDKST